MSSLLRPRSSTTTSTLSSRFPVTFATHGEYFVSSTTKGIQVWRVEDSQPVAEITVEQVQCVAFSKDGKWMAAGTYWGEVMIWDTKAYKQPFTSWNIDVVVRGVDFSHDSSRLVTWGDHRVTMWNVPACELVLGPLRYDDRVWAAKYTPQSGHGQIATATQNFVRVYESNHDTVDIPVRVSTGQYNTALLWSGKYVTVISGNKIKQIDPSARSVVAEWTVPNSSNHSCITMPKHGQFIAYSANRSVTFWDTSTRMQLGVIDHPQDIYSIALSQDGRFLAIGGDDGKVTIKRLSRITEPDIEIDDVLRLWEDGQLTNLEGLLTEAMTASRYPRHHIFAGRALVRARLGQSDEAIADAKESIATHPSILGFIAKGVSLVGKRKKREACRACDVAFEYCPPTQVSFLLLAKAVIICMAGEHDDAISRVDDLISTLHLNSICYVVQAYMYLLHGNSRVKSGDYESAIQSFERARARLQPHTSRALSVIALISGWKFDDLDVLTRQGLCEALYLAGRTEEAGETLLKMMSTVDKKVYSRGLAPAWVSDFLQRYLSTPGSSLLLLKEWAKIKLAECSWGDALTATATFVASSFTIYQTVCEQLDTCNKIMDATVCLRQMLNEMWEEIDQHAEQIEWVLKFKQHLSEKLECLGDEAMNAKYHDEAISGYSAALSLETAPPQKLLIKRSKAYVAKGLWENGLDDAEEVIAIDPSSPWGYERKHAALHRGGHYDDAIATFETMLTVMSGSSDPEVRERGREYVNPAQTRAAICKIVQDTIRDSPRILIHTISGCLLDKHGQAASFEQRPVFKELTSLMTTHIDEERIQQEVTQYYRYASFSHTWEDNEPLYKDVVHIVVYDLAESFTHNKLQMFCKIARDAGFHWAWSDTCCIDKADYFVLQEALVAMFKWYEGAAVTIVFLRGVHSPSQRGDLMRSIWNARAWTLQEYHASKVVRFYTEEWGPYMSLDVENHKDHPDIISEMEEATSISAQSLKELRPGLQDIREKLCLASGRGTTFVEDAAYSLLGIFSASLPIVYGEGDQALGRLLAQLLTSSGDTSILAWTGKSGHFNSCLPESIKVFSKLATSHIPGTLASAETGSIRSMTRTPSSNFGLVLKLYERLHELPLPSFLNQRMKLPCLTFKLGPVHESASWSGSEHVFRARTAALGVVEIRTTEDLSQYGSLTLVHPWIDFLLDRHPVGRSPETSPFGDIDMNQQPSSGDPNIGQGVKQTGAKRIFEHLRKQFGAPDTASLQPPSPESSADKRMQALQFISRLREPFGALLFTPTRYNVPEYKRVAPDSLIRVRVVELTSTVLNELIEGAHMLDVL